MYADLLNIRKNGYVDIRWLGAVSDLNVNTGTDVAPYIQKALLITNKNLGMAIKIIGNYYWGTELVTTTDVNIFGEHRPNRLLTNTDNATGAISKSPSQLFINPALTNALTMSGYGGIDTISMKATHLTVEKLLVNSTGLTANFVRCKAFGAPSRPGYCQDLELTGLNFAFLFDFETGASSYGTNYYNFSVRGGCNIYSVNNFINAIGRNVTSPSLGGLNVMDNVIEWQSKGGIKAYNLFGYNQIKNNLMEGSQEVLDITLNAGHIDIIGNYFEANSGSFKIGGAFGGLNTKISTKMYGNNFSIVLQIIILVI